MSKCSSVRPREDIPLRKAILCARGIAPKVYPASRRIARVYAFPMTVADDRAQEFSYGAGNSDFQSASKQQRLRLLLEAKRVLIMEFEVPEQIVHDALMVIPAYRRAMR